MRCSPVAPHLPARPFLTRSQQCSNGRRTSPRCPLTRRPRFAGSCGDVSSEIAGTGSIRRLVARLEIDDAIAGDIAETPARAPVVSARATGLAIAALVVGLVIGAFVVGAPRPSQEIPGLPTRFAIVPPQALPLNTSSADRDVALSPDGRYLVYRAEGSVSAGGRLMVRSIGDLDARPVADIVNAYGPFFSPDGQWLGFFDRAELKKVAMTGGPVIALAAFSGAPLGASWGDDDMIVFATDDPTTGLWRVSANGGAPAALTSIDRTARHDHAFPSVLPGGRGVLFTITDSDRTGTTQVAVLDPRSGQSKTLVPGGSQADYVALAPVGGRPIADSAEAGVLVYAAGGALTAVRFDPDRLEVIADPVPIVADVMTKRGGAANYTVSRTGTLLYVPGRTGTQELLRSLVWVNRDGHEEPTGAPPRSYGPPRLSPDATRVAVGIVDGDNTDIWILDLTRNTMRRLTSSPGMDGMPNWTRDGQRIVFMSARAGVPNVYAQSADGTSSVERLMTSAHSQWATAMTPDGKAAVGFEIGPGAGNGSVIVLPLGNSTVGASPTGASSSNEPAVARLFEGVHADISPDGRYLAYQAANESGRVEVYVRAFPHVERGPWQISTRGGTRPAWARNGRELFYIDASMTLMRVPVRTSESTFSMDPPVKVFDATYAQPNPARHYDVSPDGRRFLMVKDMPHDPHATPASMIVVDHWFEELEQRLTRGR